MPFLFDLAREMAFLFELSNSSAALEFDSHRFQSAEHQQRFETIKGWSFHRERHVQLREDEYPDI